MRNSFKVECIAFDTIQELPDSWAEKHYKDLLAVMEYGDSSEISSGALEDLCLTFLHKYEPEEAAKIVLNYTLNDRLNQGQILNISNEMLAEKIWEEYPDLSLHEELFNINQLLHQAFSGQFPFPEAVRFQVSIKSKENIGTTIFDHYPEAPLIRLLVAGMPTDNLIFRLFEEQVAGNVFKDAKDIIWQLKTKKSNANELIFDIVSSSYWFQDFNSIDTFEAQTHADAVQA